MKAALYRRYGPPSVVVVEDVPQPTPGPNDLLIRCARRRSPQLTGGFAA